MALKTQVQALRDELEVTLLDAQKADKGNKTACTRVRNSMQTVKKLAQEIRESALDVQKA